MGISFMEEPHSDKATLATLHPLVKEWFLSKFEELSPPQRYSIKNIHDGVNTLISSPTGSGKTLSAFLSILNKLILLQEAGELEQKVYCIYVSPLKALANDITKNLKEPLAEMKELAKKYDLKLNLKVATRTGDTTTSKRVGMLKKPPHILITTPESLAISLTTTKFREMLKPTTFFIIDEIHSLAENKRGVHLSLTAERLEELIREDDAERTLTRIGLSATVSPIEEVAKFLVGLEYPNEDPEKEVYRDCKIVDVQAFKQHDLKVLCPVDDIMRSSHAQMQAAMYEQLHELIQQHKTTLVFTNTRAGTERVVHFLKARYPRFYTGILDGDTEEAKLEKETEAELEVEDTEGSIENAITPVPPRRGVRSVSAAAPGTTINARTTTAPLSLRMPRQGSSGAREVGSGAQKKGGFIGAHHGSLSKIHRLNIENRLRKGELKAVVCSTSLELGIDIGSIDLVILLGSPKSVARGLQRIGRSGHKLHEKAKGRIIVLDRDDMVECSILLKSAIEKKIDRIHIPKNALDVLAQQLFGLAIEKIRPYEELYWIVRRSHCYHSLARTDFEETVKYLAGEYAELEQRSVYAKIWWDKETGEVGKRGKLARLLYLTNVGTIPDETNVKVKIGDQIIGTIDEGFLERLSPGDVFVLGGDTYEFRFARGMTIQVKTSINRPPTVPRWVSEMLPLSYDLANEIQRFRKYVEELFTLGKKKKEIITYMDEYLYADSRTLNSVYEYFREQYKYSKVPHEKRILVEHFRDGNKRHAIVHSLYGRRVNDVLSRALAYALGRIHKRDVAVTITDTGFALTAMIPLHVQKAFGLLKAEELEPVMRMALDKTEVLGRRFRHCAGRALMILRTYKGNTKSVGKQQMNARLLLSAVKRISADFPILKEARREVLEDKMNIQDAMEVIQKIEKGKLKVEEVMTALPSPFAFNILLQGYSDILKMEDRIEFLKRMHKLILEEIDAPKEQKKVAEEKIRREKLDFSYEAVWREAEERKLEERDEKEEDLKKMTWNLHRVPLFAKEEIVKLIEGKNEIRTDVLDRLHRHKEEIIRTWPTELARFVFEKLDIPYEKQKLEAEAERSVLRQQLEKAARKTQMDDELRKNFEALIDGEHVEDEAFWEWVKELLKGTVPKIWGDEIVGFLKAQHKQA